MKYLKHNQHITGRDREYRDLYFCFLNTKLVYVGASHLLESRLRDHRFPFNEYRFIKGKTNQVNKWERKLIRKYQPINNWHGLCRAGKWFRENGYLVSYHTGKILSQPIFPKVNSTYKDPKYNKSKYYRREERPSRSGSKYRITYSKDNKLWIRDEHGRKTQFVRQENSSYKMVDSVIRSNMRIRYAP
jgi:hypothetical protein